MTAIKHVAAGLLALAMLATSAMAREVPAGPSALVKGHAAAAGRWSGAGRRGWRCRASASSKRCPGTSPAASATTATMP
ncbi:hypothetical protein ACVIGA_008207 [Bradyrhizobium sp. USDA 3240]